MQDCDCFLSVLYGTVMLWTCPKREALLDLDAMCCISVVLGIDNCFDQYVFLKPLAESHHWLKASIVFAWISRYCFLAQKQDCLVPKDPVIFMSNKKSVWQKPIKKDIKTASFVENFTRLFKSRNLGPAVLPQIVCHLGPGGGDLLLRHGLWRGQSCQRRSQSPGIFGHF